MRSDGVAQGFIQLLSFLPRTEVASPHCAVCMGKKSFHLPLASLAWLSLLHDRAQSCPWPHWHHCQGSARLGQGCSVLHAQVHQAPLVPSSPCPSLCVRQRCPCAYWPVWSCSMSSTVIQYLQGVFYLLFPWGVYWNIIKPKKLLQKCER